ncbi:Threonine dehydrogenase [Propionibacterium cyclohexanicum]|uniref:Threonine dehydrogenase n=1 Tax=Propionibacterium cyclohexanicum TaxID=64702 RepID=A0A1H9SGI5_9ACTN|nr:zinc-dependent alcohol dehydrogenase [Propionibacterium cyclohexanicum]SER84150.1 Threonine dehydrogenase [Propionibacterium cyclohexanicum]
MRALTWQGTAEVRVIETPDPVIERPDDIIVKVTSTAICGSDLHLYAPLTPFMTPGDVLGHEFMGTVEQIGPEVSAVAPGDRVVVPFTISCGHCFMCTHGLQSQCETTQVREFGTGAALFGYTKLYGRVPGGQAEYVRVPYANYGPIKVPQDGPDERWLYLSDILPTAWQGVKYAELEAGETLAVVGLGPVGQLVARSARLLGAGRVLGIDRVPARLEKARRAGVETLDASQLDDVPGAVRELTSGRGADRVVEAVGMEAHGSPLAQALTTAATALPRRLGETLSSAASIDRLAALRTALECVRRGGTVSVIGVYGGATDPFNMRQLFDRQISIRMGQANVRRWSDELLGRLSHEDAFGVEQLATHHLSLDEAPHGYELFRTKQDGCLKVVLKP